MPHELGLFPPLFHHFLGAKRDFPPSQFFLSFEDALWALITEKKPLQSRPVLFPSFFCSDVTKGIETRGYKAISYPLTEDLLPDHARLSGMIQSENPSMVFLYHPLGKRVTEEACHWIKDLPTDCILIEDCADVLLSPHQIKFIRDEHVLIDSLRKVTPFQGARLFAPPRLPILTASGCAWKRYKALLLHLGYRTLHGVTSLIHKQSLLNCKWNLFSLHSDLIGKSLTPLKGFWFDRILSRYIDDGAIKAKRAILALEYKKQLPAFSLIIDEQNPGEMRFIGLKLPKGIGDTVAASVEKFRIYIDIHFDDAERCQNFDYLLLPLMHTMTLDDVRFIAGKIKELL